MAANSNSTSKPGYLPGSTDLRDEIERLTQEAKDMNLEKEIDEIKDKLYCSSFQGPRWLSLAPYKKAAIPWDWEIVSESAAAEVELQRRNERDKDLLEPELDNKKTTCTGEDVTRPDALLPLPPPRFDRSVSEPFRRGSPGTDNPRNEEIGKEEHTTGASTCPCSCGNCELCRSDLRSWSESEDELEPVERSKLRLLAVLRCYQYNQDMGTLITGHDVDAKVAASLRRLIGFVKGQWVEERGTNVASEHTIQERPEMSDEAGVILEIEAYLVEMSKAGIGLPEDVLEIAENILGRTAKEKMGNGLDLDPLSYSWIGQLAY